MKLNYLNAQTSDLTDLAAINIPDLVYCSTENVT